MKITHVCNNTIKGDFLGEPSCILTNKKGGYYFGVPLTITSKFNGLFFPYIINEKQEWDMYKTVSFIGIEEEPTEIKNEGTVVGFTKPSGTETIYMNHSNTLIYEVKNATKPVILKLDCKKIYDDSTIGRIYNIYEKDGCTVIRYGKYQDGALQHLAYDFYLAVHSSVKSSILDDWNEVAYPLDANRGDNASWWHYDALEFPIENEGLITIGFSTSEEDAILQTKAVSENSHFIKKSKLRYAASLMQAPKHLTKRKCVCVRYGKRSVRRINQ